MIRKKSFWEKEKGNPVTTLYVVFAGAVGIFVIMMAYALRSF